MKIQVLMKEADENSEMLANLGIVKSHNDDDTNYYFMEAHIHKVNVESIFVSTSKTHGKVMYIYLYDNEDSITCKYDKKIIDKIFDEIV